MKYIFTVIVLMLSSLSVCAHSASGMRVLKRPPELRIPTETIAHSLSHSSPEQGVDPWIVYASSAPSFSFEEPGGFTIFKELGFMQQFFVIDETNDYIRIASSSGFDPPTLIINDDAIDYGWVRKNAMLLWAHCIVTDEGRIDKKAMIMNTLDLVSSRRVQLQGLEADVVNFYYSSDLREATGRESRMFELFFAYKITDSAVLLGRASRARDESDREHMRNLILGWVPRNRVVMWDHRVAVEPNWDEQAVRERQQEGVSASIFPEQRDALSFQNRRNPANMAIIDEKSIKGDFYSERMLGEWFRYAVYHERDYIMRLGVIGEINTPRGQLDKVTKAEIDRDVSIATARMRNINIVFVIDGTNSMQPYFQSVSDAIERSMQRLGRHSADDALNSMRFGAVVYRDYAERHRLTEIKELTTNYREVTRFLNSVDARDYYDTDLPEAVYYGLMTALLGLLTNDDETNIIVLVGDAGNHHRDDPSQVDESEIIELIAEKKCGFLAFQVHNDPHPTYDEFRIQIQRFMLAAANNIYQELLSRNLEGYVLDKPEWNRLDANTYRLDNYINMATLVYAHKNQVMDTQLLTDEIIEVVHRSIERTNETLFRISRVVSEGRALQDVLDDAQSVREASSRYISSYNPALLNFFYNNLDIEREKLEYLCDKKFQIHTEGYASLHVEGLQHPLFRKVLLLSRQDLSKTLDMINRLYSASTQSDRRMAMQNAYIDMLIRHIGRIDRSDLLQLTIEEVSSRIVGLPGTNSFINNIRLEDITNPGVLPDHELNTYAREIDMKRETIMRIYNESRDNPYRYSLMLNNEPYYWIEDYLIP